MKALFDFQNTDKLKALHELFPELVPAILDELQACRADMHEHRQQYAQNWKSGFMTFDYWLALAEETELLIKKYRNPMLKSSRVFSEQFCSGYTVLFVNDRIIKYADRQTLNAKFKLAVDLFFKP